MGIVCVCVLHSHILQSFSEERVHVSHPLLRGSPFTFGTMIRRRLLTVGTVIICLVFLCLSWTHHNYREFHLNFLMAYKNLVSPYSYTSMGSLLIRSMNCLQNLSWFHSKAFIQLHNYTRLMHSTTGNVTCRLKLKLEPTQLIPLANMLIIEKVAKLKTDWPFRK